jgi:hypothetical protein
VPPDNSHVEGKEVVGVGCPKKFKSSAHPAGAVSVGEVCALTALEQAHILYLIVPPAEKAIALPTGEESVFPSGCIASVIVFVVTVGAEAKAEGAKLKTAKIVTKRV